MTRKYKSFLIALISTAPIALISTQAIGAPVKPGSVIKTVKQNGKILYSDQLPDTSDAPVKQFEMKSYGVGPVVQSGVSPIQIAEEKKTKELKTEQINTKAKLAEVSPEEEALKKENCSRARQNMAALSTGRVIRFREGGERYFLDANQIASERAKALADLGKMCEQ